MQALSAVGSSHPALAFTTYKHLSNRLVEAHADTTVRQLSQNRWLQACTRCQETKKLMKCPPNHAQRLLSAVSHGKGKGKSHFEDFEVPHRHQRRKSSLAAYFRRLYNDYICIYHCNIYIQKGTHWGPHFSTFLGMQCFCYIMLDHLCSYIFN